MKRKSVFDSKAEEHLYKRLKTCWSKYLEVLPQLPPRNVFSYDWIMSSGLKKSAKEYLLKTSFDFVVCDINTHIPFLVIEFDGISGGFSREAEYFINKTVHSDPNRQWKMNIKLQACQDFNIPAIVVSYQECSILEESEQMINVLDVIIADAIEKNDHLENYSKYVEMLAEAFDYGGEESAEATMLEIDMMSERANPIKKKIRELTKKFPRWDYQFHFAKPDDKGNLSATFGLDLDINTINGKMFTKRLLSVTVSIRHTGAYQQDPVFLLNTLGEYCLAMKTKKQLGFEWKNWHAAREKAEWVKY